MAQLNVKFNCGDFGKLEYRSGANEPQRTVDALGLTWGSGGIAKADAACPKCSGPKFAGLVQR